MESSVFLVDDLAAIMKAILIAHENPFVREKPDQARAFDAGFASAIRAIAAAIHVSPDLVAVRPTAEDFGSSVDAEQASYVMQFRRQNDLFVLDTYSEPRSLPPIRHSSLLE